MVTAMAIPVRPGPEPPVCSNCANLIGGRCHGLPPRVGNLAGHAVFPVIPAPDSTVCRNHTTTPLGRPLCPPGGPVRVRVVLVVRLLCSSPRLSWGLLYALLGFGVALATCAPIHIG